MAFDPDAYLASKSAGFDPDAYLASKTSTEIPSGRKEYAWSEVPGAAMDNLGKSASKFYGGVVDFVMKPGEALMALTYADTWKKIYESYADKYGSIEGVKRAIAEDPASVAADLSTLLSGGAAAAGKVGMTGTAGALRVGATATNPLAPVGLGAKATKILAKGAGNVIESVVNPKNSLYMRAAEGKAHEIINALRNAEEIVPGSSPTAAQAAAKTGVVGFQKLGKSTEGILETEFKGRDAASRAAQTAVVKDIAGTTDDMARAKLTREAATSPLYAKADAILSKTDGEFLDLMKRPSMDEVMSYARNLAREKNIPFEIGHTTPAVTTPSKILDATGKPVTVTTPAQFSELPGTSIHFIKLALDDMVKKNAAGFDKAKSAAIASTRSEFLDWVNKTSKNPEYKAAREAYSKMSEPINQMEVAKVLEHKLISPMGEDAANLRSASYSQGLRDAPGTIKKATDGTSRFQTLEEVFKSDPEALKSLYEVRDDLARQAESKRLAAGPVNKDFDATRTSEVLGGENLLPNILDRTVYIANAIWRKMQGKIDKTTAIEVAKEMLDPQKAADALEKAAKQAKYKKIVGDVINAPFAAAYRSPGVTNALAHGRENQNSMSR